MDRPKLAFLPFFTAKLFPRMQQLDLAVIVVIQHSVKRLKPRRVTIIPIIVAVSLQIQNRVLTCSRLNGVVLKASGMAIEARLAIDSSPLLRRSKVSSTTYE